MTNASRGLIAVGIVAAVAAGACADNLALNPGFEVDGKIVDISGSGEHASNWNDIVYDQTGGWVGTSTGGGRSGYGLTQNSGYDNTDDTVDVLWQTIEITAGWTVDVSAWANAGRAAHLGDSIIAVWNTASAFTVTSSNYDTYDYASGDVADQGVGTWYQLTIPSFTSSGYVTIASITDGYGYNSVSERVEGPATNFDDWSVTAVPEPATMALLVIGGAALLKRRQLSRG